MPTTIESSPLLTILETRTRLGGIAHSTIYKLIEAGDIPIVKVRRRTFVRAADVEAYIARNVRAAA